MKKKIHKNSNALKKGCFLTGVVMLTSTCVHASGTNVTGDVVNNLNSGTGVYGVIGEIIGILSWVAFAIAVVKIIQIGIMMLLGAGGGKSKAKESLIPWVVGAFVCVFFGFLGPWVVDLIMSGGSGGVFDI